MNRALNYYFYPPNYYVPYRQIGTITGVDPLGYEVGTGRTPIPPTTQQPPIQISQPQQGGGVFDPYTQQNPWSGGAPQGGVFDPAMQQNPWSGGGGVFTEAQNGGGTGEDDDTVDEPVKIGGTTMPQPMNGFNGGGGPMGPYNPYGSYNPLGGTTTPQSYGGYQTPGYYGSQNPGSYGGSSLYQAPAYQTPVQNPGGYGGYQPGVQDAYNYQAFQPGSPMAQPGPPGGGGPFGMGRNGRYFY